MSLLGTASGENRTTSFGGAAGYALRAYLRNERPAWVPVKGEQEPFFVTQRGTVFTENGWASIRDGLRERLKAQGHTFNFSFHRCRNK